MLRHAIILAMLAVPGAAFAATAPMSATTYLMKAGASDQYEIQSSKLVMGTHNADLKQYADQMVTDHNKSTADVKAAAQEAGLKVAPPHLDAMGAKNIAALKRVSGTARDRLYIQQQKKSHQMALMVQQDYAANGKVTSLRTVAGNIVPVVQSHIEMLNKM